MEQRRVMGAKGGSAKQHTPTEQADNLISINKIKILLAISDGEVEGDFSPKMVMFDDVPIQNDDGSYNYEGVKLDFRPGTQDQSYIQGFADTASEITVNRALKFGTPYVFSVTNNQLSAARVKIYAAQMMKVENDGDKVGTRVEYAIDMAVDGGSYERVITDAFDGKTTSGYDRSHRIDLPAFNEQVLFRVSRLTADSDSNTVDDIQVQSYAEVIDAKFRYPLTGLLYVEFDSKMFPTQIPTISIKKKWKLINVPRNYDPVSRTYSGSWDGTFKRAWTNNPAWVLYDLITNQRYGLDQRELGIAVDKWSLYEAGQYCDVMVPDGKGGTEPRYLCDVVIQGQIEAYQLVRDICSIFRGMSFWNGESLSILIDRPRDPSYLFTNDNVVGGSFSRTFASEKSMYTSCNVTFDDEQNSYQQDIEPVFDREAALRFGNNPTSITAIGCTRRSEANRRGRWILKTNLRSTVVNFSTGLEGMIPMIGDVIAVSDQYWGSNLTMNLAGRVMEVSGLQVFTMFKVDARPGDYIMINKPDGAPVKRTIASVSGDGKTLTLNVGFGFQPQPNTVFIIERTDIVPELYVITGITKGDSGDDEFTFAITAAQYDPNKYDEIDLGVNIDDRPTSVVAPDVIPAPENVQVRSESRVVQGISVETMIVSWDKVQYAALYEVQWRKNNGNWINVPQTALTEVEVEGIYAGTYSVRVRAINTASIASAYSAVAVATLTGKVGEPGAPINLMASTDQVFGIRVKWGFADGSGDTSYTEVQQSPTGKEEDASLLSMVPYPQYEYWHSVLPAGYVDWYRVRTVDRIGNVSPWTPFVSGMATNDFDAIAAVVKIDIENSAGFKELIENSTDTANRLKDQAQADIQNALAGDYNMNWTRVENGKRKAEFGQALEMIADETEARISQVEELRVEIDENISAQIKTLNEVVANETETRARQVSELQAQFGETSASIGELNEAIATETEARVKAIQQLQATITDDIGAAITNQQQALANEAEARAQADQALSTRVGSAESAITQKLSSWIDASGIGASYTLSLGIKYNGVTYNAGMNMQLTQINGQILAQTIFDVDRFAIGRVDQTNGTLKSLPFFIENNQVFMQSAVIKDGSITTAKIGQEIGSDTWYQSGGYRGWNMNKNGTFTIAGDTAGQGRMIITGNQISVYDGNGVLRCRMGQL